MKFSTRPSSRGSEAVTATPERVLTTLLPRWRASLSVSSAAADAFLARHHQTLLSLITRVLGVLDGRFHPDTAEDFAAFDVMVPPSRRRHEGPDADVIVRLLRRVDAVLAQGFGEVLVLRNQGQEYVDARAEAILLRKSGWDAVPLLSNLPALAIVIGECVVAVRSSSGALSIHPARRGTLNHLQADVYRAEARLVELAEELPVSPTTRERLAQYATQLWERARADRQGVEILRHDSPSPR